MRKGREGGREDERAKSSTAASGIYSVDRRVDPSVTATSTSLLSPFFILITCEDATRRAGQLIIWMRSVEEEEVEDKMDHAFLS